MVSGDRAGPNDTGSGGLASIWACCDLRSPQTSRPRHVLTAGGRGTSQNPLQWYSCGKAGFGNLGARPTWMEFGDDGPAQAGPRAATRRVDRSQPGTGGQSTERAVQAGTGVRDDAYPRRP